MIGRFFRRIAGLVFLLLAASAAASQPPNIVVLMADDLGWNDVGYHGSDISTPAIDAMAAKSVRLDQFYVFPWCAATRAGFESGLNPARFGMRALEHNFDGAVMPRDLSTVADILHGQGYFTALIGKWHLSHTLEGGPRTRGYDEAFGYLHGQMDHLTHEDHSGVPSLFRDNRFIAAEGHMTDLIYNEVERIVAGRRQPFFLNVAFSAPHYPLQAPQRYLEANAHIAHPDRRLYAAMVSHMDDVIGKIMRLLQANGLLDNTIVVLLSDNGGDPEWSNPNGFYDRRHGPYEMMADNRPLRGGKTYVYEGGIRVPALVRYPRELEPRDYRGFVTVLDLLPTLAAVAGASAPGRDGRDVWQNWRTGATTGAPEFYWFSVTKDIRSGKQDAVRSGDWKLIESQRRYPWLPWRIEWPWPRVELYNLRDDPDERNNLIDKEPGVRKSMRAKLDSYRDEQMGRFDNQAARTMSRGSATP